MRRRLLDLVALAGAVVAVGMFAVSLWVGSYRDATRNDPDAEEDEQSP
jgi:hypothetical protein